ncbi:hypothetical protein MMC14_007128 [Varicellaria rhodocarpa]|nr:hypothetical protein [Varicellaria rhodocarpa]
MEQESSPPASTRQTPQITTSALTSPIFSSTLPLGRTTSDSVLRTRRSFSDPRNKQAAHRKRTTRSYASSFASSSSSGGEETKNDISLGDFSIDLAKLGGSFADREKKSENESAITVPKREIEDIPSEDDGPTSFTINMEKWMRGTGMPKGGHKIAAEIPQDAMENVQNGDQEASQQDASDVHDEARYKDQDDGSQEAQIRFEQDAVTPGLPSSRKNTTQAPERQQSERSSRPDSEMLQRQAAEEVFNQISALQAEVEQLRIQVEDGRAEKLILEEDYLRMENENEEMTQELQASDSRIKTLEEHDKARMVEWNAKKAKDHENSSKFGSLRAKFEPMVQELESAKSNFDGLKKASDAKILELKEQLRLSQEKLDQLDEVEADRDRVVATCGTLRSELAQCKQALSEHQEVSAARDRDLTFQIGDFKTQLQSANQSVSDVAMLRNELEHTQQQLTESRRIIETVEEENDRFTQKNESQALEIQTLKVELDTTRRSSQQRYIKIEEAEISINNLEKEIEQLRAESNDADARDEEHVIELQRLRQLHEEELDALRSSLEIKQTESNDLQLADQLDQVSEGYEAQLKTQETTHAAEMKKLKSTLIRAAEGMKKREDRIGNEHAETLSALRSKIVSLEEDNEVLRLTATTTAESPETEPTNHQCKLSLLKSALVGLKSQLSSLQQENANLRLTVKTQPLNRNRCSQNPSTTIHLLESKLSSLQSSLSTTKQSLASSTAQILALQEQLSEKKDAYETGKKAVETKFSEMMENREREWRRRIKVVFKEREIAGRALMWAWGDREVGLKNEEGGMGYRYVVERDNAV